MTVWSERSARHTEGMVDAFAKEYLHSDLRDARQALLWKLDGLSEYDARRPMTITGTNLLGLVKHLTMTEALYFGEVFGRAFPPEDLPWTAADAELDADTWATETESRSEVIDRYSRVCAHSDNTIADLSIDTAGHVAHWPRPEVMLFNVMVHVLSETLRHAGHADILREQIDGAVGADPMTATFLERGQDYWATRHAKIERAARNADTAAQQNPRTTG